MSANVTSRAHGRVNLIGEHTDYNGGWVLPTAIPQYTEIHFERSDGNKVRLHSSGSRTFEYQLGDERPHHTWVDYLAGGTKLLREKGVKLSGFTAHITSSIPEGSGVSSSAALEMSFLKGLKELFHFEMSPVELAKIGQRIENEFVGAKVGIMDQMATSLCEQGEALFLDTQNLTYERIPLPLNELDIMVINSGVTHRLSSTDGGYNERRAQCEEVCRLLNIPSLRELSIEQLQKASLPDILMKRARHVITENQRVKDAVVALRETNLNKLGQLFLSSHASMRDDYQVSIPEIDLLVELCTKHPEVYGARLTGGGFGGSIVAALKKGTKESVAQTVLEAYHSRTKEKGTLLA